MKELHLADCLNLLEKWHNSGKKEFIDLIYIDPPFNSKRNYNIVFNTDTDTTEKAFTDIWSNVSYLDELETVGKIHPDLYSFLKLLETTRLPKSYISYLTAMSIRVWYMREMMKDTGSFYYHCDPTMSHYIKVMLDYIFGRENFRNEIVWCYTGPSNVKNNFPRKHDTIFLYTKTEKATFNIGNIRIPYKGNFTMGSKKSLARAGKEGSCMDGAEEYIQRGKIAEDYWVDINALSVASERLGYPTQKPEALLERIIKASSNEGDVVADFYMGGGTTISVAQKLNRDFIGCDINYRAIQITKERVEKYGIKLKKDFFIFGIPRSSKELKKMVDENIIGEEKNSRFALEDVIVKYYLKGVIGNEKKVGDGSVDGVFSFTYNSKQCKGLVQITAGSNKNHLKAFCSEIGKGTGDIGVYITFEENITDGFIKEVKSYGKIGEIDKIQLLTIESIVDKGNQIQLPKSDTQLF